MKQLGLCLLVSLGLTGCGDTIDNQIPTYTVTEQEFIISVTPLAKLNRFLPNALPLQVGVNDLNLLIEENIKSKRVT